MSRTCTLLSPVKNKKERKEKKNFFDQNFNPPMNLVYYLGLTTKVDWDECHPNNASGVHSEANELGLVEIFRHISRLDGVQGAKAKHEGVKCQWQEYSSR